MLENVYFVYSCSIFSLHCFVQFAENKDIELNNTSIALKLYTLYNHLSTQTCIDYALNHNVNVNPKHTKIKSSLVLYYYYRTHDLIPSDKGTDKGKDKNNYMM